VSSSSLVVDPASNLYIADYGNSVIRKRSSEALVPQAFLPVFFFFERNVTAGLTRNTQECVLTKR
jgi:hypothetical protein